MQMFEKYLFRSHSISSIIPNQKTKAITATMQKEYRKYVTEWITGDKRKVNSIYFEKGIACEPQAIRLLQDCLYPPGKGFDLIPRKKVRKHNEYVTGEADVVYGEYIYDIKNAFNEYTFTEASMNEAYKWQLDCYMWLWDKDKSRIFYALIDMPESVIERDLKKVLYDEEKSWYGDEYNDDYLDYCNDYRKRVAYSTYMEPLERFKIFDHERNDDNIEIIKESVLTARENMEAIYKEYINAIEKNKVLMGIL